MAKVAVASTDGLTINEHFGKSKEFLVYEVDEQGGYTFIERRERDVAQNVHEYAAKLFSDVEAVLSAQVGPRAEQELRIHKVLAFQVTGAISKALESYGKRGKFVCSNLINAPVGTQFGGGCGGGCKKGCR